jgi:hypothetical protein
MRQFDPQKRRRIRRHRPRHRRRKPWEKRPQPPISIQAPHRPPDRRPPLRALQPALDRIHRKHRDPHRHARARPRHRNRTQTQLPLRLPLRVLRRHPPLRVFISREIRRGAGPVARERHGRAAENAADAAVLVELADDVDATGVAGFLAGGERLLALDLEEDFDALEGGGDEGHGDGGEEAGGGDLGDGEGGGGGGLGGEGADEGFADVVALGGGEGGLEWMGRALGEGYREGLTQKLTATGRGVS